MNTTRCPQCGFRAELQTETEFHTCRQCHSLFRLFSGQSISEQYYQHEQDDPLAWGALLGSLESEEVFDAVSSTSITFGYHPFWFADFKDGSTRFKVAGTALDGYPLPSVPPPGDLEFPPRDRSFPPPAVLPQTVISGAPILSRLRLLQLPLYLINFEISGVPYQATVSGCSWQAHLPNIPNEKGIHLASSRLVFLGVYCALLLLACFLAPNIFWRCGLIFLILMIAWWLERSGQIKG